MRCVAYAFIHARAYAYTTREERERERDKLNVRSSLWKKETPSLERVNTSRVKREVIVRQ